MGKKITALMLVLMLPMISYGEDIAICAVEPSRGILEASADFVAEALHDSAEVAGSLFLGDEYSQDARLGEGDTIWDAAFLFGIAGLANFWTLGNVALAFTRYLNVNDISRKNKRVVRGEISQSKLDKPQKIVAALDNKWIPLSNSSDVRNIGNWLILKGFPWLTGYKVPKPTFESVYEVNNGSQKFGIVQRPPEKDDEEN